MMIIRSSNDDGGRGFRIPPMPDTFTIRHDIPIPLRSTGSRWQRSGPGVIVAPYIEGIRKTMIKMDVGDSFVVPVGTVPGKTHEQLLNLIILQGGYVLGVGNFVAIAVQDGVQIWRTE
jgi:hypothetical protein